MIVQTEKIQKPKQLVMASASPRRAELIQTFGIPATIMPSHCDESVPTDWSADKVVEQLALRKARAVVEQAKASIDEPYNGIFIVGADTVVVSDGEILGKPLDEADAAQMLKRLQNHVHTVMTGVAIVSLETGEAVVSHGETIVSFKAFSDALIERYIRSGEPMDKAGAYGIQGLLSTHIDRIEGCYFNVVGFPLSVFSDLLASFGLEAW